MKIIRKTLLAVTVVGAGSSLPLSIQAAAEEAGSVATGDRLTEIVVTASDLAMYTPGLTTNTRFGDDD